MHTLTPTPDAPRILAIRRIGTMADRTHYRATVDYGPENGGKLTTEFLGSSTPGFPGPVLFRTDAFRPGHWESVDSPQRFGDTFDGDWVARFYAPRP